VLSGLLRFGAKLGLGQVIARSIPFWRAARPLPHEHDFAVFARDGYRRNVVVYACVNEIAGGTGQVRLWPCWSDDTELEPEHPLVKVLRRPNPEWSRFTFIERLVVDLEVMGNAYVWKRRNLLGKPAELWRLRPDRVRVIPAADGSVKAYEHKIEGVPQDDIPTRDVVHLKLPDPLDAYYGLSPLAVCARFGDLDNQAADYLRAFFTNGASPAGLLKLKNRVGDAEKLRIRLAWKDNYATQLGWHDLAVLDADAEYQELGSRPEKLRMDSIFNATESRICAAYGVPPIVVQVQIGLARSTFANYREAVKSLWTETITPTYDRVADELTRGLAHEWSEDLQVKVDYSRVEVLQEAQAERRSFALSAWDKGVTTLNETRDLCGLPRLEGPEGDERRAPAPAALFGPDGSPIAGMTPGLREAPAQDDESGLDADEEDYEEEPEDGERRPARRGRAAGLRLTDRHAKRDEPSWRALYRVIGGYEELMKGVALKAVADTRKAIVRSALVQAIESRHVDVVVKATAWEEVGEKLLWDRVPELLRDAMEDGGNVAARYLARAIVARERQGRGRPGVRAGVGSSAERFAVRPPRLTDAAVKARTLRFDIVDPRAIAYIRDHAAALIRDVSVETVQAVRDLVARSFEEGIPPRALAKLIEDHVGLTAGHVGAVSRLRSRLEDEGAGAEEVARAVERETRRLVAARAEAIARTEIIGAAHEGQELLWHQAVAEDLLDPALAEREWIVTDDDRLCRVCEPLDGATATLARTFSGGFTKPPDPHPQCRCAVVLRPFGKVARAA